MTPEELLTHISTLNKEALLKELLVHSLEPESNGSTLFSLLHDRLRELVEIAQQNIGEAQKAEEVACRLDAAVFDCHRQQAEIINQRGRDVQIQYLISETGWTADELAERSAQFEKLKKITTDL
jgi:hypothetical protein